MAQRKNDLKALRNMIADAQRILATAKLPDARSERAYELLTAALHLSDHLLTAGSTRRIFIRLPLRSPLPMLKAVQR